LQGNIRLSHGAANVTTMTDRILLTLTWTLMSRSAAALVQDMCWLTETLSVARHRSMVSDAAALPPQGLSLVSAAGKCRAHADQSKGGGPKKRYARTRENPWGQRLPGEVIVRM
jgi:hypothetical protein